MPPAVTVLHRPLVAIPRATGEPPCGRRCRQDGGEPATPHRGGPRGASAPRRRCRLRGARARTPGHRLPHRLPVRGLGRRRGGGRAGGVRQGVARAAALPARRAVPAVAARDRGQRGSQPPPRRRPAGGPRAPRGAGAGLGGRGSVPRGRAARRRRAPGAARGARRPRRARPRRHRLPPPARPLRARDGGGPRLPVGDGEVAPVARARPDAGRARARRSGGGGGAVTDLERQLALLRDEIAWPPTPDLAGAVAARIAAEPDPAAHDGRRPWTAVAPRVREWLAGPRARAVAIAALVVVAVVAGTLAAAPGVRARIADWLGIGAVRIERVDRLPDASPSAGLGLGTRTTLGAARRSAGVPVPTITALGPPDAVYVDRRVPGGGSASVVYLARPGLPSATRRIGALLTMLPGGDPLIVK